MDIVRINKTTFLPEDLIEGYESAIWTERYDEPGDFTIVTADIKNTRSALPLDSLVSHTETAETMIVETHAINTDENGVDLLTVTGRSVQTFWNNRVTLAQMTPDQAYDWGHDWIGDNTGLIARHILYSHGAGSTTLSAGDAVPGVIAYPAGGVAAEDEGEDLNFHIAPGPAFDKAVEQLKAVGLGIRSVRTPVADQLWIQIYRGTDRTVNGPASGDNKVILRTADGHFDSTSYLWSNKNHKTVAAVTSGYIGGGGSRRGLLVARKSGSGSGWTRRVLHVDASDITKAPPLDTVAEANAKMTKRARAELNKPENKRQTIFEGRVSSDIPFIYKTHYNLGDLVTVQADYGINQTLQISEYVRSDNEQGDIGYPTLSLPNEL